MVKSLFKRLFGRKKELRNRERASFRVIGSCEDHDTNYIEFIDGLRLIFREGRYVGWYMP